MTKGPPHHVIKTLEGWRPVSKSAREFHAKTKLGQVVEMKARRPRNPAHHRKLFALLGIVVDNTDLFASTEDALTGLKAITGHGRWERIKGTSKDIFYPDSIAFDAMSQAEFEPFYDAALAAVRRWWLPVADADLRLLIERVENLQAEAKGIADDIKDVFGEVKATGYDVKIVRQIIKLRRIKPADRREQEQLIETYKCALGME